MKQLSWIGPTLLALGALGGVYAQQRRVERLEARLGAVGEQPAASAAGADLAGLAARVARLEQAAAWRAGASAPAAPPAAGAAPPPLPGGEPQLRQLREDVDALLTGEASATEQGKARLRALIAETQQQQWDERQVRRDERILQQLSEGARLSSRQREDLGKALEAERSQRREILSKARAGQPEAEGFRAAMQALRAQTDQKAREILDAGQYEQYTSARAAGPGRGPRERGGPGSGSPAGGPR